VIFRRITSPDVPTGITSWRSQPCVPGCFSGHCILARFLPASRPGIFFPALRLISAVTVSLSALVSAANLSTTLFLDGLCFPGASRTGLRSRLPFAKKRVATEGDWRLFPSCAAASLPRMYFPASLPDEVGLASF
jgi:hypothetical protein